MVFKRHRARDIMLLQMTTIHSWVFTGFLTVLTLSSSDLPAKMIITVNDVYFKNTVKSTLSSVQMVFPFFRNLGNTHLG